MTWYVSLFKLGPFVSWLGTADIQCQHITQSVVSGPLLQTQGVRRYTRLENQYTLTGQLAHPVNKPAFTACNIHPDVIFFISAGWNRTANFTICVRGEPPVTRTVSNRNDLKETMMKSLRAYPKARLPTASRVKHWQRCIPDK